MTSAEINHFLELPFVIFRYFLPFICCNMYQTLQTIFPPFPLLLRKTAAMSIPLSALIAALFQILHNNIPPAVLVAMHEKWDTIHANTEHIEILDAGAQQGLVILFSDGEWRDDDAMIEKPLRLQDETAHGLVSLEIQAAKALRVTKLLKNFQFSNCPVYMTQECSQNPINTDISHMA